MELIVILTNYSHYDRGDGLRCTLLKTARSNPAVVSTSDGGYLIAIGGYCSSVRHSAWCGHDSVDVLLNSYSVAMHTLYTQ